MKTLRITSLGFALYFYELLLKNYKSKYALSFVVQCCKHAIYKLRYLPKYMYLVHRRFLPGNASRDQVLASYYLEMLHLFLSLPSVNLLIRYQTYDLPVKSFSTIEHACLRIVKLIRAYRILLDSEHFLYASIVLKKVLIKRLPKILGK